jgi:hypothetical protein
LGSDVDFAKELKQELREEFPHLDHWFQYEEFDINQMGQTSRDLGIENFENKSEIDSFPKRGEIVKKMVLKTEFWM